ncbi:MAG: CDP-alcohol phosphatidyltransferase family protein [Acidimicrobiales bacterium]
MTTESFGPSALATPANALTLARVLATPVVLAMVLGGGPTWPAVAVWFLISMTDVVDGVVARRQGATRSGAFFDPLADKVVVLAMMVALVAKHRLWWLPVALITLREVAMSGYRSWVARRGVSVPARPSAKIKTVVQSLAVGMALAPLDARGYRASAAALLWVAVALTVLTGAQYLLDGRRVVRAP